MDSLTVSDAASAASFSLIDQSDSQPASSETPEGPAASFMEVYGEALLRNGYRPIPIQPGLKLPGRYQDGRWTGFPQWSRFLDSPPSEADVATWSAWPGVGVGLVTGDIIAVDIDVLDRNLVSEILCKADKALGETLLYRVGLQPKLLLVYRVSERMKKRVLGKVEILGEGQQFVAYGIHPTSQQPYRWTVQSPDEVAVRDLPVVTSSGIEKFLEAIAPLIKGPVKSETSKRANFIPAAPANVSEPTPAASQEKIHEAMGFILNADLHWDDWNRIGMALYQATAGAGFEIFDDWSRRSTKYDQEATRERWEGIRRSPPDRIGGGLIFRLAREGGWQGRSDSSGIASLGQRSLSDATLEVSPASAGRQFRFLTPDEIFDAPASQTWLIKNLLEIGGLAMLVGESGVGKSFVVIDMAVSVALGEDWLDLPTAQGPVFVIAGEGYSGFRNRLRAISKHRGKSLRGEPIFFSNTAISLNDPASVLTARKTIESLKDKYGEPALIIIDTLHRNAGGADENSAKDISTVLKEIDSKLRIFKQSCAVLIVHHSGHNDKFRARGSSSLYGAMDTELMLKKDGEDSVTLSVTKQKNHEPMRDITLKFQTVDLGEVGEDDEPIKSRVVVKGDVTGGKSRGKQLSGTKLIGQRELENLLVVGEEPPDALRREMGILCPKVIVKKREWQRACIRAGISPKSSEAARKAFNRMFNELNAAGIIKVWSGYVWLCSTPILMSQKQPDIGTGQDK